VSSDIAQFRALYMLIIKRKDERLIFMIFNTFRYFCKNSLVMSSRVSTYLTKTIKSLVDLTYCYCIHLDLL
jgi:hypothetical protein